MAGLDVAFAKRYLDELRRFGAGEPTSGCWEEAFGATRRWRAIVRQHLLLGVNAHINLDLGAAAESSVATLAGLQRAFDLVNGIPFAMLDDVQDRLTPIWPLTGLLD